MEDLSYKLLLIFTHINTYYGLCLFYLLQDIDLWRKRYHWNQYKLQSYTEQIWTVWTEAAAQSMCNSAVVILCIWFLTPPQTDISLLSDICKIPLFILLADLWFYVWHRLLHKIPFLYRIHKIHHATNLVVAASAMDAHILENLVVNLGTVLVPAYLLGASKSLLWLFTIQANVSGVRSHSGYKSSIIHNKHHQMLNINYGTGLFIIDRIFKTFA